MVFLSLRIPKLVIQTIHQFLFFQVSSTALALPDPSFKMLLVLAMEPFFGSRGPDPGSEVKACQQTPILLALLIVTCLRRPKSHLKKYGWVLELGFHTLREREGKSTHSEIIRSTQSRGHSLDFQ